MCVCCVSYRGATHEDDDEGFDDPSDAHHPGHPEKQNDSQNVLKTGQIDAHQRAHPRSLQSTQTHVQHCYLICSVSVITFIPDVSVFISV